MHHLRAAPLSVLAKFAIAGELVECVPLERGHIHDTFISTWNEPRGTRRFLHQRLNESVFCDIPALMHNIARVTRYLRETSAAEELEALELVTTRAGADYYQGPEGAWRTYVFIDGTQTFDRCLDADQAYRAARAFGGFQRRLRGLEPSELLMTIPRFFSSPYRLEQLDDAHAVDARGRVAAAANELAFVAERRAEIDRIEVALRAGRFPERVVHGDTKLNNVLFDRVTNAARAVVDLDTCMPGWSLYDFGDLVRFTAATSAEDERDLGRAGMDLALYRALVAGYLDGTGGFLTALERDWMPFAARLVTLTVGMRFLADHLAGDPYFKIARPEHNLDRARVQFALVASMEAQTAAMAAAVR